MQSRRRSHRIKVSLKAEHVSGNTIRPAFIENISEQGMHMVTLNRGAEPQFSPGRNLELKLRLSAKETVPLVCEVRWTSAKTPPEGVTDSVGLQVINPPERYVSFVRALHISQPGP